MFGGLIDLIFIAYASAVLYALLHDGDGLPTALIWPLQQLPAWLKAVDPNLPTQITTAGGTVMSLEAFVAQQVQTATAALEAKLQAYVAGGSVPAPTNPTVKT